MDIYAYQHPLGKIDDIAQLRDAFIAMYDTKTKRDMVQFCLLYGAHLLQLTGFAPCTHIEQAFAAMQEWLDGTTNYHKARNICFEFYTIARTERDPVRARFYRTMAQIAASPHVKYHGLWATDFGVTLINRMYPDDMQAVAREREKQIELLGMVGDAGG